jgi:hypothetical protein
VPVPLKPDMRAVLDGIRDANYRRPGVRCLRLLAADEPTVAALVAEISRLRASSVPSMPSNPGHVTSWTRPHGRVEQFSLLNASGRTDDYSRDHDGSCRGKRFHDPARYPRLAALAASLPHLINFRVNVLGAPAQLAPHEEHSVIRDAAGHIGIRGRFHLPLVTNPRAQLLLDGHLYHLSRGIAFFVNHGCVHAAENLGPADRIHLVWDMLITREAAHTMFGDGALPAGFSRLPLHPCIPAGSRAVTNWERIAPHVLPRDAAHIDYLEPQ